MRNLNPENIRRKISKIEIFDNNEDFYPISVVIVSFNGNERLIECLNSLNNQTESLFELILIDNGGNDRVYKNIKNYKLKYIELKENYGISEGRNVGISLAKGEIICFLDDDSIADRNLIKEHLNAYKQKNILGLRGKIIPKTKSIYNKIQVHYDLGNVIMPSYIDTEGNCSFKKEVLQELDGFDPKLFGHEGAELSYRIIKKYQDKNKLIYYPKAIIFHDFSISYLKFIKKQIRHRKLWKDLVSKFSELPSFISSYNSRIATKRNINLSFLDKVKVKIILKLTYYILKYFNG